MYIRTPDVEVCVGECISILSLRANLEASDAIRCLTFKSADWEDNSLFDKTLEIR